MVLFCNVMLNSVVPRPICCVSGMVTLVLPVISPALVVTADRASPGDRIEVLVRNNVGERLRSPDRNGRLATAGNNSDLRITGK